MDKFLDRFSNFFVRSVAPSSIFFVLLFFNDMYFNNSKIYENILKYTPCSNVENKKELFSNIKDLKIPDDKQQVVITIDKSVISADIRKTENDKSKDPDTKSNDNPNINLIYIFIIIIFIAYGYLNQILTQILDYMHEKNFIFLWDEKYNKEFINLKDFVIKNLTDTEIKIFKKIELSKNETSNEVNFYDYNAYEVLGKEIEVDTFYVDEAKTINTFSVALILNLIIYFFSLQVDSYKYTVIFIVLTVILILFFLTKARYKARNKRLYINYLLKKEEKGISIK